VRHLALVEAVSRRLYELAYFVGTEGTRSPLWTPDSAMREGPRRTAPTPGANVA